MVSISACKEENKQQTDLSKTNLTPYQINVLSPDQVYRDIYDNAIAFNFKKYRIPFIKNGSIEIEKKENGAYRKIKNLDFKDSLLVRIKEAHHHSAKELSYNSEKQLVKIDKATYTYHQGKLSSLDYEQSEHSFTQNGNCINWDIKDKSTDYLHKSILCYNEQGKVISDRSNFKVTDKNIYEEHLYQFDQDKVVRQEYTRLENDQVLDHLITNTTRNQNGLHKEISSTLVNQNMTFFKNYEYLILTTNPLKISKKEIVLKEVKKEIHFTFNSKGQLIQFEQLGKYGDKYRIIYKEI